MYLTEDEAKGKGCPMVSGRTERKTRGIMGDKRTKGIYCIASECMMWRTGAHRNGCTATKCYKGCGYGKGYCGLAGKPE